MSDIFKFEINNSKEVYEINKVAKQANGAVLLKEKNSVLLATVCVDFDNAISEEFVPLTVQYIEKYYASGKIPGGFVKRESRPSEFEILTSRLIDRSIRPLFGDNYRYDTVINVIVLSADENSDLQILALNAVSAAIYLSDLPINKLVHGIRIGKFGDNLVVNPAFSKHQNSSLDLCIAGTKDELLMIEMKSIAQDNTNIAIHEDELIDAISLALDSIVLANDLYLKSFDKLGIKKREIDFLNIKTDKTIRDYIQDNYKEKLKEAIFGSSKLISSQKTKDILQSILNSSEAIDNKWSINEIKKEFDAVKKDIIRESIINRGERADKRGLKDIRDINIETNILPMAHSSCLFTRGETQALVVATLGGARDSQMYDLLTENEQKNETFMVHYNFPGFSVGEASIISATSRRELGHGNLAKKALESSIDLKYDSTIRLVSEILESNGSSSMATVCAGSIALKAAKVPIYELIAGVAMGLVMDGDKKAILTDITGLEDHYGDMDLKVAGSKDGITALQMDIKANSIELKLLKDMLYQAKEAIEHILSIMHNATKNIKFNNTLPAIEKFNVNPNVIFQIIGIGGKTIKEITSTYDVEINIDKNSGEIRLSAKDFQTLQDVKKLILEIESKNVKESFEKIYSVGEKHTGIVKRVAHFGAFVELPKGGEGLLHISKLSKKRVDKVTDVVDVGDTVDITIVSVSSDKIELCMSDIK